MSWGGLSWGALKFSVAVKSSIKMVIAPLVQFWSALKTLCKQGIWSDWVDAQADLSLCWVHTHFVLFVVRGSFLLDLKLLFIFISKIWFERLFTFTD